MEVGLIALRVGVGLRSVTLLDALAEESAALVARIVIVFGFGKEAGAVYMPEALMVPVVELPPETLFTVQTTPVLLVPVTVAVNCCELPARTLAGLGETETWMGPEVVGGREVCVPETWAQPACWQAISVRRIENLRPKDLPSTLVTEL